MPEPQPDKLNREKRVLLTQAEEREIERLVSRVAAEVSTPVKLSHLLRACVTLLRHAEDQVADQARQAGTLTRPSNGDPAVLAEFEHRLAQIPSAAFRDIERLR
jgi:DNA repair ATPase RecN